MARNISEKVKRIARERIELLFDQAEKEFDENPERSHRYVEMARNIAMKINLKMPKEYKRKFCKHCYSYLVPGENARVRLDSKHRKKVIKCEECGEFMRIPYRK